MQNVFRYFFHCVIKNILFLCDVGVYLHEEKGSEIRSDLKLFGDTQTSESTQAQHTTTRNQTLQSSPKNTHVIHCALNYYLCK